MVEERLRHLLRTSPAIIFDVKLDTGHQVHYISDNIEDATGFTPQQYYDDAQFGYKQIHPEHVAYVAEQLARLSEVERVSYDYRFRVSTGEYKWFHDDAVGVYGDDGHLREIVGSIVDIDERKRMEEEQAATRDQAVEASRLKSEFLATVSHEIRTPLNGVIGMADLLLATPLDPEQLEYVKTMAFSADSLLVVINDVLDLSKVEAGKMTLLETEFAPRDVAQSVADLLLPRAREKGITVGVVLDADLPNLVCGYEARLRQVLLNLVGNAVKFTEQGRVAVSVTLDREAREALKNLNQKEFEQEGIDREDKSIWVRFTVSDTGIGLDEANFVKLFQPFSQVDSSLARKYGGAGLGLAISKRLVELMGGQIGVESEVGKGSDFWFTVPLDPVDSTTEDGDVEMGVRGAQIAEQTVAQIMERDGQESTLSPRTLLPIVVANGTSEAVIAPADNDPQVSDKGAISEFALLDTRSAQILLVEDNAVNQKVALAQLKRLGYTVHAVFNGREAVEAVELQAYDVVLMDCQMPEMDGFEATRLIRQREERIDRHVPIIAMTANAMNGDREACLAAGMDDYLAKPIRAEELGAVLERWIGV